MKNIHISNVSNPGETFNSLLGKEPNTVSKLWRISQKEARRHHIQLLLPSLPSPPPPRRSPCRAKSHTKISPPRNWRSIWHSLPRRWNWTTSFEAKQTFPKISLKKQKARPVAAESAQSQPLFGRRRTAWNWVATLKIMIPWCNFQRVTKATPKD